MKKSKNKKSMWIKEEWLNLLWELPSKEFKRLFLAMYDYQTEGKEPPEFEGMAKIAALCIFPELTRRRRFSEMGKRSAKLRAQRKRKEERRSASRPEERR